MLLTWFGRQPVDSWFITDVVESRGVTAAAETVAKDTLVPAGSLATGPDSELELQLGDDLRFRMLPNSRLTLPSPPGRWLSRSRILILERGEIYGTTGDNRLDFALKFETVELTAQLTGTTFAVFRTEAGSCVCLWSGAIQVTSRDSGESVTMTPETRLFIFKDGRPPHPEPINDMERMKLQMMHDGGIVPLPDGE